MKPIPPFHSEGWGFSFIDFKLLLYINHIGQSPSTLTIVAMIPTEAKEKLYHDYFEEKLINEYLQTKDVQYPWKLTWITLAAGLVFWAIVPLSSYADFKDSSLVFIKVCSAGSFLISIVGIPLWYWMSRRDYSVAVTILKDKKYPLLFQETMTSLARQEALKLTSKHYESLEAAAKEKLRLELVKLAVDCAADEAEINSMNLPALNTRLMAFTGTPEPSST